MNPNDQDFAEAVKLLEQQIVELRTGDPDSLDEIFNPQDQEKIIAIEAKIERTFPTSGVIYQK
jgi:hypothetical protein